ncbi:MAG: hypothetical protein J6I76_13620 [Oribacterium sp.]|nr:hypothetical protein [Oribacterium sp.]
MKWYKDYGYILAQFEKGDEFVDETTFYFCSDPKEIEHYIGYQSKHDKPYRAGYCDIEDGCEFNTAKELFEAKIYDGQSIKDRWDELVLINIGGIGVDDWDGFDYAKWRQKYFDNVSSEDFQAAAVDYARNNPL